MRSVGRVDDGGGGRSFAADAEPINSHKPHHARIYTAGSPALDVKSGPAWRHYSIGPPYIAHKTDLARIAHHWHDFVPRVYEGHPHLLAEMYAYSVASAHLKLPHLRLDHYMTSEAEGYGEAWSFIDDVEEDRLCVADLSEETRALPVRWFVCSRGRGKGKGGQGMADILRIHPLTLLSSPPFPSL